jgi:hypothetical protein
VSWVWLSPPTVEFGEAGSGDGAEQVVWLHADPYAFLDVPWGSDHAALRGAYRKAARVRHPDAGASDGSFDELQRAFRAALGDDDAEVAVEPTAGSWWSFLRVLHRPVGDEFFNLWDAGDQLKPGALPGRAAPRRGGAARALRHSLTPRHDDNQGCVG